MQLRIDCQTYVLDVGCESVIYPSGQNLIQSEIVPTTIQLQTYDQVILLQLYPNPLVALTSNIEESSTIPNISNLLILMQVFIEEHLDLFFIDIAHFLRGNRDYIAILVASLQCELIDISDIRKSVVEDSKLRKIFLRNFPTGIVEFTLVDALVRVSLRL